MTQMLLVLLTVTILPQTSSTRAAMDAINADMLAAFAKDPASVSRFYADDALIVGGGQTVAGRDAVDKYWRDATMFQGWTLEVIAAGGTAEAPWQYGRSVLVGRSGRTMETYYLGLLRRDDSGRLRWVVDGFSRERRSISPAAEAAITARWAKAAGGDAGEMRAIRQNPLALLSEAGSSEAPAQPASSQAAGPRTPFDGPARTDLADAAVTLPLTKEGGFYFADVQVNGRPFRFTLETGAGFFGISSRAARALGLRVENVEVMPGTMAPVAVVQTLQIGAATFHDLRARVRPEWDTLNFDGIISIPVLRQVTATLDLGRQALRLERAELPPPNGRDVLPIPGQDRGGRIDVPVAVGDSRDTAVLDTRADFWLIAPDALQGRFAPAGDLRFVANAYGPSVGAFEMRGARSTTEVRIGAVALEKPAVVFRDRPAILVGVPLLEQLVIAIDQRNRRLRIASRDGNDRVQMPVQAWERGNASAPPAQGGDPPSGTWTIGFMMRGTTGGPLTVARVLPGSAAEREGVRVGDQVMDVGGTPAASLNPAVTRAIAAAKAAFQVILVRDGKQLTVTLTPHQVQ